MDFRLFCIVLVFSGCLFIVGGEGGADGRGGQSTPSIPKGAPARRDGAKIHGPKLSAHPC